MKHKDTITVLRDAADLIEKPGAWTQWASARDVQGQKTISWSSTAVCWCALGAISKVTQGQPAELFDEAVDAVAEVLIESGHGYSIADFNDTRDSAEPVAEIFRKTADKLERKS